MEVHFFEEWFEPRELHFTCGGCGRDIVGVCMYRMSVPLCGACLTHPGWVNQPIASKALDPFHDRDDALITLTPTEIECRSLWLAATHTYLQQPKIRVIEDISCWDKSQQRWLI